MRSLRPLSATSTTHGGWDATRRPPGLTQQGAAHLSIWPAHCTIAYQMASKDGEEKELGSVWSMDASAKGMAFAMSEIPVLTLLCLMEAKLGLIYGLHVPGNGEPPPHSSWESRTTSSSLCHGNDRM